MQLGQGVLNVAECVGLGGGGLDAGVGEGLFIEYLSMRQCVK